MDCSLNFEPKEMKYFHPLLGTEPSILIALGCLIVLICGIIVHRSVLVFIFRRQERGFNQIIISHQVRSEQFLGKQLIES